MATPDVDNNGFLADSTLWTREIARQFATEEGIELGDAHWEIIGLVRDFYQCYDLSPHMRALVRYTRERLSAEKASSIYLMQLFGGSPARTAARIAGLPKPDKCL